MDKNGKTPLDLAYEKKHTIIIDQDKKYTITLYSEKKKNEESANKYEKLTPKSFKCIMHLG